MGSAPRLYSYAVPPEDPADKFALDNALEGLNAGYVASVYEAYRSDPGSVEPEWRRLFDAGYGGFEPVRPDAPTAPAGAATNGNAAPPDAGEAAPAAMPGGARPLRGPSGRLAANMAASLAVPTATSFRDVPVAVAGGTCGASSMTATHPGGSASPI